MMSQPSVATAAQLDESNIEFILQGGESAYILKPMSDRVVIWVDENIGPDNGFQSYFPVVVIERRYIGAIVEVLQPEEYAVR